MNKINPDNKELLESIKEYVDSYKKKYRGFPCTKLVLKNTIITQQFIRNNKSYINLIDKLGYDTNNFIIYKIRFA